MKTLYAKQKVFKIEDHYAIKDDNDVDVYYVDQKIRLFGYEVKVSDANRQPAFTVHQEMLNFMPTFRVDFEDGRKMAVKSRISFFKKKIDIDYSGEDLRLTGNVWDWDFAINGDDGKELASIGRKFLAWGDTYTLEIIDEKYSDVAVAMMIVVDRLLDIEQSNN